MMRKFTLHLIFAWCFVAGTIVTAYSQSDLIISEYIEGSSFNKAIEIYNGTGGLVDLSNYSLEKDVNGDGFFSSTLALSGTLTDGEVYVLAHGNADAAILDVANVLNESVINFNGNDQIRLIKNGLEIDRIGISGNVNFAKDLTFIRHSNVTSPQAGEQDPRSNGEWEEFAKDDFSFLGSHFADNSVGNPVDNDYYATTVGLTGNELKTSLHKIIRNHKAFPYSSSTTDVWDILKVTDEDPNNKGNVILFYTGRSESKSRQDDGSGDSDSWNREHIWAKSHGFPDKSDTAYTDVHHLRATDQSVNTSRSSKDFDNGGTEHNEATGNYSDADSWEPRDQVKGDVARMMFYMATRYEGDYDLELVDYTGTNSGQPIFGKLSTLLEWHADDPVDEREIRRNTLIYEQFQGNRNPFIDHPEFVERIWGTPTSLSNLHTGLSMGSKEFQESSLNLQEKSELVVYPNPSFGKFKVIVGGEILSNNHWSIMDMNGKVIRRMTVDKEATIDISELKRGIYILQVETKSVVYRRRIVLR
ncbi:endonuclease [Xanthovirga aplysinae]|uniref:endonuclease n=1 Tax=Xanthovirga aplysinae TaxID=2529853 RepID=UPI0012BBE986|nr:endonuclease [Xanthovirga aplysinae]MTI31114.1 T9SS type A sorting domain-containing protein [Xanthovirga aplysinae]